MVSYVSITIPELYPYVLLMTGLTNFLCIIVGFMAGSKRKNIFSRDFMQQFDKDLQNTDGFSAANAEVPKGGYPDMGNGWYGQKLSYKDWFEFQLDQRSHKNFLEGITIVSFCALVCGLTYPELTLILISLYFVGRILYTAGYKSSPKARMFGAPIIMLVPVVMMVSTAVA